MEATERLSLTGHQSQLENLSRAPGCWRMCSVRGTWGPKRRGAPNLCQGGAELLLSGAITSHLGWNPGTRGQKLGRVKTCKPMAHRLFFLSPQMLAPHSTTAPGPHLKPPQSRCPGLPCPGHSCPPVPRTEPTVGVRLCRPPCSGSESPASPTDFFLLKLLTLLLSHTLWATGLGAAQRALG